MGVRRAKVGYPERGTKGWQVHPDHGLHLDDAGGNLDEAGGATCRTGRRATSNALASTRVGPTSASRRLACRSSSWNWLAVALEQDVRSPALMGLLQDSDMVFGPAAPAIDILVDAPASVLRFFRLATTKRVSGPSASVSTRAMIRLIRFQFARQSKNSAVTMKLLVRVRGLESRLRAGFETFDMAAQCRCWRRCRGWASRPLARHLDQEKLGAAIVAVGPQQDLGVRSVERARDRATGYQGG